MALQSSLVAKIETPIENGSKIGTAYAIAKGYIITAYHVFDDIDDLTKAKISWPQNDEQKRGNQTDDSVPITKIIYENEDYDIVIAKCETPEHSNNVNWCCSYSVTGQWTSIGFAATGKDQKIKKRLKDPAAGQIMPLLEDDWTLQLASEGNASNVTLWRGMSGAPVFIEGSNTLLAIITNTPPVDKEGKPVHEDRLYSVSIPYLLNRCPKFKEKVSEISFESDISVFLKNAAKVLKDKKLTHLFTNNDETLPKTDLDLSRHLSQLPLRDLLRLIFQLQGKYSSSKVGLGELVCTLLPHLFDDEKATEIRTGIGDKTCPLIAIPYATPVSAEMLMAKVDYRDAQITTFTQKSFVAKYRLPLPPEEGNEQEVADNIHLDGYGSFAGDLQKLIAKNITTHLFEQEVEQGVLGDGTLEEQDKIDFVKQTLADRVEDKEHSYYFIVDIKSVGGQDQVEPFSTALKQIYPHCAIIYHDANSDKRLQETSDYRKLREIMASYLKADNT